jgi:hypothetical protein
MAVVALSFVAGLALPDGRAFAQLTFEPDQCAAAVNIAEQIKQKFDISPRLEASFERFRRSRCDVETRFERDTEIDVKAFLEFRFRFELWKTCNDNPINRICQ